MFNNHVTLTGHLGARPETRVTAAGQTLATVRIAVSKSYKDAHGNYVKDTQWFRVTGWGRQAERMTTELDTGDRVCFTGRLSCRSYETRDGHKRESVEVIASGFEQLRRYSERKALVEIVADAERDAALDSTEPTTPEVAKDIVSDAGDTPAVKHEAKIIKLEHDLPF